MTDEQFETAIEEVKGDDLKDLLRSRNSTGVVEDKLFALQIAQSVKDNQGVRWFSISIIATIVILTSIYMFQSSGEEGFANVANGRAFLMIVIIFATTVFGGTMLYSALFGPKVSDKRAQQAREIFVFFSGTFGTVVGFYFASATNEIQNEAEVPRVTASLNLQGNGQISATILGGQGTFTVSLEKTGDPQKFAQDKEDSRKFSLKIQPDVCPAGGRVLVTQTSVEEKTPFEIPFDASDLLAKGWTACESETPQDEGERGQPDGNAGSDNNGEGAEGASNEGE